MYGTKRRTFVRIAAAAAVTPTVAGCTGGGSEGGDGGSGDLPAEIDDYLSGANGYDGSLADHTGESEVTVEVGTGANGFGFDPAVIGIEAGTTVVWEWTGQGGAHNVVDEDGAFESELQSEAGATFEHTFEESGTVRYYCNPHRGSGMKGGIVVE